MGITSGVTRRLFMGSIPGAGLAASKAAASFPTNIGAVVQGSPLAFAGSGGLYAGTAECAPNLDHWIGRAKRCAMRLAGASTKGKLTPEQKQDIERMRMHNLQYGNRLKSVSQSYANLMYLDELERQFLRREEYDARAELEEIKERAGVLGYLMPEDIFEEKR